jgi:hypothetical protein
MDIATITFAWKIFAKRRASSKADFDSRDPVYATKNFIPLSF